MTEQIVLALYRPHEGEDEALRALIAGHLPALRRLEFVTGRPGILARSEDGTYLEIFEWRSEAAAGLAHEHPEIARLWERMGEIADFRALSSLSEAERPFPHFETVSL